jgi:nucleotide-binding universal stress UspA family protein
LPPPAALPQASSRSTPGERQHAKRWIAVGCDRSEAAQRALLRAADAAGERGRRRHRDDDAAGLLGRPAAEPLLETSADPSELLAPPTRRSRVVRRWPTSSSSHGRAIPAQELLEVARAASADLGIVGRRGTDFVARTLLGSVATRVVAQASCDVPVVA